MEKTLMSKLLIKLAPIVRFIDTYIRWPHLIKKVNGEDYYLLRDKLEKGYVILTNMDGLGISVLNPSDLNHSGLYVGKNFLSRINKVIYDINEKLSKIAVSAERSALVAVKKRIEDSIVKYNIRDNIYYVVEANIYHGVRVTDLVTFLTTKDRIICCKPKFCDDSSLSVEPVIKSLGLPYDFGFSHEDDMKYCFELCADAYTEVFDVSFLRNIVKIFGVEVNDSYLSDAFLDNTLWDIMYDSDETSK